MAVISSRLTFANVVSVIALFVALGGSAWAISANSVGSQQLKKNAVKNPDIADDAVKSPEVENGSLLSEDFAVGQLPSGAQGPPGVQGDQGVPGTARAYAYVEPSDCPPAPSTCAAPSRSKGVSRVSRAATGFYCISAPGIDSRTTAAAVTVDWFNTDFVTSRPGNASAMYNADPNPGSFCPGGGDFVVTTEKQPVVAVRNSADNGSVNVSGPAAIADNVAFTIVIP
jgi:hypothetical protein